MALKLSKSKTLFRCQECGYSSTKWLGKCADCGKWNSLVEETVAPENGPNRFKLTDFSSSISLLSEISAQTFQRVQTGISEFDRMMGGGIVPGSLTLLGGPPGIGKSTLTLQIAAKLAETKKVLYISGEESQEQIKARAERLELTAPNLFLLSETNLENMLENIRKVDPEFLMIDSIQTTYRNDLSSAPGSVGQIRECTSEFLRCAKSMRKTVFLLGHVTKDGDLAGPRVLEHIVDTVLYFESERTQSYRILRAYKNRFGPTSEIAIFEMGMTGLKEVKNPSELFLCEHQRGAGTALVTSMEGTRPLVLEIQSLVTRTHFGLPRRMVTGIDFNRALLLIAVLEKKLGLNLQNQDIFVNVVGGVKIGEPATDLGIACSIAGAFGNFCPDSDGVFIGEIGLGGEVRPVPQVAERVREAERIGLSWAVVPKRGMKEKIGSGKIKVVYVETLKQVFDWVRNVQSSDNNKKANEAIR